MSTIAQGALGGDQENHKTQRHIDSSAVPPQLRDCARWVLWTYEERDGKLTKVPKQPSGWPARVNDSTTWCGLNEAIAALQTGRFAGVGIVLGGGLAGVDIDWKNYNGEGIPPAAQAVLDRFASYAELSPSGRGAHVLLFATLPAGARNRATLAPGVEIEIYDRHRYFTFTGQALNGRGVTDQQEQLEALLVELNMIRGPQTLPRAGALATSSGENDEELLRRMFESAHGAEIKALWEGTWEGRYKSHSEADLALTSHLLWWTNGDAARTDRLFRKSGLYREKWNQRHFSDGRTYGQATIDFALAGFQGGYDPHLGAIGRVTFYKLEESDTPRHPLDGCVSGEEIRPGYPLFKVVNGALHAAVVVRGKNAAITYTPVANFAATVKRVVAVTDGATVEKVYEIEGYLRDGRKLPLARVPYSEMHSLNWMLREWDHEAVVHPGAWAREQVRSAILHLGVGRSTSATRYKHLGWVRVGDKWVYLHAGGGITSGEPVDVEVDLGAPLCKFALPDPPSGEEERDCIHKLWELRNVAPKYVVIPLVLYALSAPLGHAPFSLYVAGPTGVRKTSLALVVQSFFGYVDESAPLGWEATANALEGAAFSAKDTLLLVDDYAPTGHDRAQKELQAKAARILRSQGNAVGRLRMRADSSMAGDRPPRGSILVTGEDLPPGHSVRARALVVDLAHGDVNLTALSVAQQRALDGVYAKATAAWIRWLSADLDTHKDFIRRKIIEYRPHWTADHGRTTDALARLEATWELYKRYAASCGVELGALDKEVRSALQHVRDAQSEHTQDVDPVQRFVRLLHAALRMGRGHVKPSEATRNVADGIEDRLGNPSMWGWCYKNGGVGGFGTWEPRGAPIGWVPEDWPQRGLYLDPEATYTVLNALAREHGEPLPTPNTLWKSLAERGVIRSETNGETRFRVRAYVEGRRLRVVCVKPEHLTDLTGGDDPEPGNNGPSGGPQGGGNPTGREPGPAGETPETPQTPPNPPAVVGLPQKPTEETARTLPEPPAVGEAPQTPTEETTPPPAPLDVEAHGVVEFKVITTPQTLFDVVRGLRQAEIVAMDLETTGKDPHTDRIRLVSMAAHKEVFVVDVDRVGVDSLREALAELTSGGPRLVFHNAVFDLGFLLAAGVEVDNNVYDTALAEQLLTNSRWMPSLAVLVKQYLGVELDKSLQRGDWKGEITPDHLRYAAADAFYTLRVYEKQGPLLRKRGAERAAEIDYAATKTVAWMKLKGVVLDVERWESVVRAEKAAVAEVREKLPPGVNWNSPSQVLAALREAGLDLPSTRREVLAAHKDHPVVADLLRYRNHSKRASSYSTTWKDYVKPHTGRVHADWFVIGAETGRMSCEKPNLMQVPRDPVFRACFYAPEGRVLVKADFSQIELRLAALIARDERMLAAFRAGEDLHIKTASAITGKPETQITKSDRQLAKALNFGLIYGMGAAKLRESAMADYGVVMSEEEAARLRWKFFDVYRGLRRWHRSQPEGCVVVRTLTGRPRETDRFTEKLNSPVQGSGADMLKRALALLWERRGDLPGAYPVLAVHDEIVLEAPAEMAARATEHLKRAMTDAANEVVGGGVPIEVEVGVFVDWGVTPAQS